MTIKELLENAGITLTQEQETKLTAEFPKAFKPADVYNTDVKKHKDTAEELKTQLDEANKTIDGFKALDIEGVKKSAEEYKTKFEQAEKDYAAKVQKMAYDSAAEKFVDTLKPKDPLSKKAILGEFVAKEFKLDGDSFVGANEWAESFKKDNAAHFADGTPQPGIFAGKLGSPGTDINIDAFSSSVRKAAGLPDTTK